RSNRGDGDGDRAGGGGALAGDPARPGDGDDIAPGPAGGPRRPGRGRRPDAVLPHDVRLLARAGGDGAGRRDAPGHGGGLPGLAGGGADLLHRSVLRPGACGMEIVEVCEKTAGRGSIIELRPRNPLRALPQHGGGGPLLRLALPLVGLGGGSIPDALYVILVV